MKKLLIPLFACLVLASGVSLTSAASYTTGDNPTISESVSDDVYVSGSNVTVSAPVLGELFAAGDKVTVSQKPSRSVFAAGNTVTLSSGSGYNVFAAGNEVTIKGEIAHDVFVVGNRIIIDPSTVINGTLHIAGNDLTIAGQIKGNVEASGSTITSNAVVGGNFKGDMGNLTFTGGSIGGNLDYKSPADAKGLSTVTVAGTTTRSDQDYNASGMTYSDWLWAGLATLVTGLALIFLMPRKLEDEMTTITSQWRKSFGWGFLTLIVTPIVAALLIATMIGMPLGFVLIAAYAIALYVAGVIGQILVGSWLLKRFKNAPIKTHKQHLIWSLIVGIVVVSLITTIPLLGSIIAFLLFIIVFVPALGAAAIWINNFIQQQQTDK